jgi:hypothetical protein
MNMQLTQGYESSCSSAIATPLTLQPAISLQGDISYSPLALEGWLRYNSERWNLRPERVCLSADEIAAFNIETVLYFNRNGKIVNPPYNPYLPARLTMTPTESATRLARQWFKLGTSLAGKLEEHGLGSTIPLDPAITDARPFQWAGFRESLRYTLYLDLPIDITQTEHDARKNIAKARRLGYYCTSARDTNDIISCLVSSEERQGFQHRLRNKDLELLLRLLGSDHIVSCVCYSPDGEAAAARVLLLEPGAPAIDWVGGTKTSHLHSGATQLSLLYAIDEAHRRGASVYDLAGANIHRVAQAKMKWRGRLVPYLQLQEYGLRSLARFMLDWRKAAKLRRSKG